MIKFITFEEILPIWKIYLWPDRKSNIESHSQMLLSGNFSQDNFQLQSFYYGYYKDGSLTGVNSLHLCTDNFARSRGLWVFPTYRGMGIGKNLLEYSIQLAKENNCSGVWSFPRKTAWNTYKAAGFNLVSDWVKSETSEANAYCLHLLKQE